MIRVIRAEWCKLRRPTLFLGSLGAVIGVTGLVTSLLFLLIDSQGGNAERGERITREILQLPSGVSMLLFGVATVLVSALTAIGLAFALSGRAKVSTDAWTTSDARTALLQTFVNVLISTIGYGTVGMILGLLLRSPISSISIGVAWLLVVESIISIAWKPSSKWMPGQLLSIVSSGGTPIGMTNALSYSQALLRVTIYLIAASAVVGWLFKRRDVSN